MNASNPHGTVLEDGNDQAVVRTVGDYVDQPALVAGLMAARARKDFPAMIAQATVLRHRFPATTAGYQVGSFALRETGRMEEAAAVLAAAAALFNDSGWVLAEQIRLAQHAGDWESAADQAKTMRHRFPAEAAGWRLGLSALRQLGRISEAEAMLEAAPVALNGEEWVLVGLTALAARREAWDKADTKAAALRAAFPSNEAGYRTGLRSLRRQSRFEEAAALLKEAETVLPGRDWLLLEAASLAQGKGDRLEAVKLWGQVRDVLPNESQGYSEGFKCNIALGRIDEAERLSQDAKAQFRMSAWLLAQPAEIAAARGLFGQAAQHWAAVRAAYPRHPEGYRGGYRMARKLGRLDEAETVLEEALAWQPADRWALIEWADLAEARRDYDAVEQRRKRAAEVLPQDPQMALRYALARSLDLNMKNRDWPITLTRLQALNDRLPDYAPGWQAHIKALRFIGSLAEAKRLAQACLKHMPNEPELWLECALTEGDDSDERAQLLAKAVERFPGHVRVQVELGNALGRLGRLDEADKHYRQVLEKFPNSANLLCGYATIAMQQRNWQEALRRWQAVQEHFPEDTRATIGLVDSLAALGNAAPAPTRPVRSERAEMFWRFESLGGTGQACEFGCVQRAGGAEPLGLLRWTSIEPAQLLEALASRFGGVGTPEQTMIDLYIGEDPENPEYRYNDTRLKTRMHTFIRKRDMPMEQMFEQTCRRITYLRDQLIEDLEDGDKVFVYKIFERNLENEELKQLHHAMRMYGENTLLYVRYADDEHPNGTVTQVSDGLLIGYISGFNIDKTTLKLRPPDQPAWEAICAQALDLHEKSRAARAAPT